MLLHSQRTALNNAQYSSTGQRHWAFQPWHRLDCQQLIVLFVMLWLKSMSEGLHGLCWWDGDKRQRSRVWLFWTSLPSTGHCLSWWSGGKQRFVVFSSYQPNAFHHPQPIESLITRYRGGLRRSVPLWCSATVEVQQKCDFFLDCSDYCRLVITLLDHFLWLFE